MSRALVTLGIAGVLLATGMAMLACTTAAPRGPATSPASSSTLLTVAPASSDTAPINQHAAFLAALDHDGVPRSKTGDSEVLIGRGVCGQLAAGRPADTIAAELSGSMPWNHAQALTVVRDAQRILC